VLRGGVVQRRSRGIAPECGLSVFDIGYYPAGIDHIA
jgi:hypothetical protein